MEPTEGYDIGLAVSKLRRGYRVVRKGWNGKGMWLEAQSARVVDGRSWLPFVLMSTVGGALVPWLCSQTDLLANDWEDAGRIWEAATATAMPPIPPVGPAPYVEIQTPATSIVIDRFPPGPGPVQRHRRSPGCCAVGGLHLGELVVPLCEAWPDARADDRCGCGHVLTMHAGQVNRGYGGPCYDRFTHLGPRCLCEGFIPPPSAEPGRSPDTSPPSDPAEFVAGKRVIVP